MTIVNPPAVGCTFVMFRGAFTGRIVTCGVCAWCRDPKNFEVLVHTATCSLEHPHRGQCA